MRFGQFGREDGVLAMVTQNGCLIIKILKRTVTFEEKELIPGTPMVIHCISRILTVILNWRFGDRVKIYKLT